MKRVLNSNMDLKMRAVAEGDIDNIINACIEEGWVTFNLRKEHFIQAMKKSTLIVAYDGEIFAGFARAMSDEHVTTFICELLVVKEYRNKGIGRMLVEYIWNMFPHTRIDLISESDGFYERMEFRKLGTGFRKHNW